MSENDTNAPYFSVQIGNTMLMEGYIMPVGWRHENEKNSAVFPSLFYVKKNFITESLKIPSTFTFHHTTFSSSSKTLEQYDDCERKCEFTIILNIVHLLDY